MKQKISPAFYAVCAVLLACLTGFLFGSCGFENSCTVVMEEAQGAADPVTLTVEWNGTSTADLTFTIDGYIYTLEGPPTVDDPVYRLDTAEDDGMTSVFLQLAYDEAEVCRLYMVPEEGDERVFTCEREEMRAFYAWVQSN